MGSERSSEKTAPRSEPGVECFGLGFVAYKHVALVLLVAQTVGAIILMRVSKTIAEGSIPYLNTTAVFFAEIIKLFGSFLLVLRETEWNIRSATAKLHEEIIQKPWETLKVGIPAILYTLQNNLLFIALANMSPALYQVTYQLKILTTALLSVLILRQHLSVDKWTSLLVLTAGVALIQVPGGADNEAKVVKGNVLLGTIAVLCACLTSGFAGVYFEKILKGSRTSIWMRNIQLALLSTVLALTGALWSDFSKIRQNGFMQGYNWATWGAILAHSAGGLIVAAVLKYADNILKCFGNALAIALSCLTSYLLIGDYTPTLFFLLGTTLVIIATYTYNMNTPVLTLLVYHYRAGILRVLGKPTVQISETTELRNMEV